jgi:hypothetical protein
LPADLDYKYRLFLFFLPSHSTCPLTTDSRETSNMAAAVAAPMGLPTGIINDHPHGADIRRQVSAYMILDYCRVLLPYTDTM